MAVSDWDRRELCPDGSCTGLIGPEGTCKVCGRAAPNWGDERKRGTVDEDDDEIDDDDSDDPVAPSTPVAIGGGVWQARQLCSDGGCIGVIGDDGKCKVCGKPAGPAVARGDVESDDDDDDEEDDADDDADSDEVEARDDDENDDEDDDEDDDSDSDEDDDSDSDEVESRDDDEDEDGDEDGDDDDDDDEDEDDDESDRTGARGDNAPGKEHDDLAAAAAQLAGVASSAEVAAADRLADASKTDASKIDKPGSKAKKAKSKSDDDDDRQLCPDGGCIGVIGPDGKCKVCGKEAAA